ncbi:MAG TPA: glycosyltransferase family 2 protein [Allosphingosinicella sp.]|nr:glycosyltransferase family 2 protein [Allosphingosinicella sp.]
MQAKVHIVIVNWNSGDWLRRCVASIADHGSGLVDRVVVVDNGSTDGSAEFGRCSSPPEVVAAGANLGFARASNLGARGAAAPFLLFLNPDAALGEDTLSRALAFMESPEAAGIAVCGIRLVDEHGGTQRHCASFPTPRTFLGSATGLSGLFPRLFPPLLMEQFDHLESRRVDHVIGAFYLVRRELFERLGGFDERFFVYLEDLDLSLRVREAGWQVHYLAEATAFHKGGGTSEQVKARRLFYSLRSRNLYAFKHFRRRHAWTIAFATLLIEPLPRLIRALARLSPREALDTLRAFFWLWRDFPSLPRRPG